jgi:hypothetical protein
MMNPGLDPRPQGFVGSLGPLIGLDVIFDAAG